MDGSGTQRDGSHLRRVRHVPEEPLGRRIARLRTVRGWNQQELAARLAMSRTAVSHLEAGMSRPSERTLVLLAGLFDMEPPELVADTDYPVERAERLPLTALRYSKLDLTLSELRAQLALAPLLPVADQERLIVDWQARLRSMSADVATTAERQQVALVLRELDAVRTR